MRKYLFGFFAVLFALPAFGAAVSDQEKCETDIKMKYSFNYESNQKYQDIYSKLKNQVDTEWDKYLDTPLESDITDGLCTSGINSWPY